MHEEKKRASILCIIVSLAHPPINPNTNISDILLLFVLRSSKVSAYIICH